MIRYARELLEYLALWLTGITIVFPRATDMLSVFERVIDAAEVVIPDDYDPPPVVVDTREQRPFSPFLWQKGKREYLPPERLCLSEGDYSSPLLLSHVRIERKSIPDLYGSLFGTSLDSNGASLDAPKEAPAATHEAEEF